MAMCLAFISKESSYTFPLLPGVWLAVNGGLKERRGWYALAPFFAAAACVLALRWALFGGIGGYRDAAGAPQALSVALIPVLKTFALRLWAVLFFPINWSIEPGTVFGIVTILYLASLLPAFVGWDSKARFSAHDRMAARAWPCRPCSSC